MAKALFLSILAAALLAFPAVAAQEEPGTTATPTSPPSSTPPSPSPSPPSPAPSGEPKPGEPQPAPQEPGPRANPPGTAPQRPCEDVEDPEKRQSCVKQWCMEHPREPRCHPCPAPAPQPAAREPQPEPTGGEPAKDPAAQEPPAQDPATSDPKDPEGNASATQPHPQPGQTAPSDCKPPCGDKPCPPPCDPRVHDGHDTAGRCKPRRDTPEFPPDASGRHLTFRLDAPNRTLLDVRVDGILLLESLVIESDVPLKVSRDGRILAVAGEGVWLELHDNPVGQMRFKGDNASLVLTFPEDSVALEPSETTRIQYPDGPQAFLNAREADWNGTIVEAWGFAVFHLAHRDPPAQASLAKDEGQREKREMDERLKDAADRGHLGAQVTLRAPEAAQENASEGVEVLAFDDVNVTVDVPAGAGMGAPLRIVVSADLEEGRTVVLDVDPEILQTNDPDELVLRYFDVNEDGTETEVVFRQASSLQDILDPTNDEGQPEYRVVSDAAGIHVMVSVPHWSTHVVTLASVVEFVTQPSVLVGIAAGVGGSVVAAAMLLWPRRRDEIA